MTASHWVEAFVTPLLVIAAIVLSPLPRYVMATLNKTPSSTAKDEVGDAPTGFIVPAQIHHARILPRESQHSFNYPSIYYALELHALEQRKIDRAPAFTWRGMETLEGKVGQKQPESPGWSVTKLCPRDFGRKTFPEADTGVANAISGSMLLKLLYELRHRNFISSGPQDLDEEAIRQGQQPWALEVGQIWAIAMPTIFGMAGFNPLTVYYVHRPSGQTSNSSRHAKGALWLAVLEVHNTFNERHIYVCEVGKAEDEERDGRLVRAGYDHAWTFARDFHVSPFNDRSGYYRLLLRNMWREGDNLDAPTIDVRLLLLEPSPGSKGTTDLQKKLLATLSSSQATSATSRPRWQAQPISTASVTVTLLRQPFDLFLPVARIMWEASKLHWRRKLPVYIRPEPSGDAVRESAATKDEVLDGVGWPTVHNPAEYSKEGGTKQHASGGIFWNDESFIERACRRKVESYLLQRTATPVAPSSVYVRIRNPEMPATLFYKGVKDIKEDEKGEEYAHSPDTLSFYATSAAIFTDLCLYVPAQAFLFGCQVERGWGVSSRAAFEAALQVRADGPKVPQTISVRVARRLRTQYMRWAVQEALNGKKSKASEAIGAQLIHDAAQLHPLDASGYPFALLSALAMHIVILRLTAAASKLLRVNYVRHPWSQVGEGIELLARGHASR